MCDRVLAAAINKFVEVQCRAAEYSRSSGEGNPVIPANALKIRISRFDDEKPERHAPRRLSDHLGLEGLYPNQTIESLAVREGKSERSIRMTLSLAFMSPVLAEAAMEGRLPRGFCVKRLTDLPMLWSEQWRAVGLQQPIQAQAEPI